MGEVSTHRAVKISDWMKQRRKWIKSRFGIRETLVFAMLLTDLEIPWEWQAGLSKVNEWTPGSSSVFVSHILDRLCFKDTFTKIPQEVRISRQELKEPWENILSRQLFDKNPVAIHFCSDVVLDPDYQFTSYNEICSEHYRESRPLSMSKGQLWISRPVLFRTLKNLHWLESSEVMN